MSVKTCLAIHDKSNLAPSLRLKHVLRSPAIKPFSYLATNKINVVSLIKLTDKAM